MISRTLAGGLALLTWLAGSVALAEPPKASQRPRRYSALDVQGTIYTQLLPRVSPGLDLGYAIGLRGLHARLGAIVVASPPFDLGVGRLGNVLATSQAELCAAKEVLHHRIRVCLGGQGGVMAHRWQGFNKPGRKASPWVAGTIRGDYRIELSRWFGVMFGANVAVPLLAPQFRGEDGSGYPSPIVFPGPVAGAFTLGGNFDLSGALATAGSGS